MKSNFKYFLFLFCITLLSSCASDDNNDDSDSNGDPDVNNNIFSIGQVETTIGSAFIRNFEEQSSGVYDWDIILVSNDVIIDTDVSFFDASGFGSVIYIDLLSDNPNGVTPGTYNLNQNAAAFSIDGIEAIPNKNFDDGVVENDVLIGETGTLLVEGTANDIMLTLSVTSFDGTVITASYSGSLQLY